MHSAAGGSSGDGSVDVKMLAEQNVQLKEALKRLHSHSIAEKTDVSVLVWTLLLPSLPKCGRGTYRNVYPTFGRYRHCDGGHTPPHRDFNFRKRTLCPTSLQLTLYAFKTPGINLPMRTIECFHPVLPPALRDLVLTHRSATLSSRRLFDHLRGTQSRVPRCKTR